MAVIQTPEVEETARALFAAEYKDEPGSWEFDEAPGWEQEMFRRRAYILRVVTPKRMGKETP
jgi:hypothetical protein